MEFSTEWFVWSNFCYKFPWYVNIDTQANGALHGFVHFIRIEQSILFQAFEFGFGHETDAKDAEVIVTLNVSERNDVQTWQFKHSKKSADGSGFRDEFGIKCGAKNGFQVRFLY